MTPHKKQSIVIQKWKIAQEKGQCTACNIGNKADKARLLPKQPNLAPNRLHQFPILYYIACNMHDMNYFQKLREQSGREASGTERADFELYDLTPHDLI